MKKYRICLFFIFVVGVFVSSALGYAVGRQRGMALERTRLEAEQNSNHNSERNSEENAGQKLPKNSQDGQGGQGNGQADRPVDTQSLPETLPEDHEATNQRKVGSVGMAIEDSAGVNRTNAGQRRQSAENSEAEQSYYLVAEDGFLLVFLRDRKTICLYTHMPLMDFSVSEQERLREGIWFSSMLEVFNYLESCTS
ncbi:hypothetical protein AAAY25_07125 [Brotaphodocola catenula]|uniref:hypothetical protein n=1 Tax=Brotaphodocola catenula TaxID=2885361 RepID=UPI002F41E4A2